MKTKKPTKLVKRIITAYWKHFKPTPKPLHTRSKLSWKFQEARSP